MKFEAGGTMHTLRYTVNAVADLEEMTGKSIGSILKAGEFSALRALVWAGLTESNPQLTLKGAGVILGEYLNDHGVEEMMEVVSSAIEDAGFLKAQTAKKAARK